MSAPHRSTIQQTLTTATSGLQQLQQKIEDDTDLATLRRTAPPS